jgi:trehalose-phosphatase
MLRTLASRRGIRIAIVTGRSLGQIRPMVRALPVDLAVNHGLEIVSGRHTWVHPFLEEAVPLLTTIMRAVTGALGPMPGVRIEDKRWSIGVHFRKVAQRRIPVVRRLVREIVRPHGAKLTILRGKKVLEIRPAVRWTKGHAVLRLLSGPRYKGSVPVFIGDDRTDEDGFAALEGRGITIRVGRSGRSIAQYRVAGVPEVAAFLEWLLMRS